MRKGLPSLAILVLVIVTGVFGISCAPDMESPAGAPPAGDTPGTKPPEEGAPPATEAPDAGLPVTGIIEVRVTDAPPRQQVTSIVVTVSSVRIHKAVAEQEREQEHQDSDNVAQEHEWEREQQQEQQGQGAWVSLDGGAAKSFDLIKIKGLEEVLTVGEVELGRYTQIRMTIETVEVTIGDGEPQTATVPSGELRFTRPFDVMEDETTVLILDFDADRMVTLSGSGKVTVKPVVRLAIRQGKSHHQN
jgi:hypothetical protein